MRGKIEDKVKRCIEGREKGLVESWKIVSFEDGEEIIVGFGAWGFGNGVSRYLTQRRTLYPTND